MTRPSADLTDALFRAAHAWLARHIPGRLLRRIRLDLDREEDQVVLPVPVVLPPVPQQPGPEAK